MESFGAIDIGRYRKWQEDAFLLDDGLGLYVVADGMGGPGLGDVAARLACSGVKAHIATSEDANETDRLRAALLHAHHAILEAGRENPNVEGLSATIVAVLISRQDLIVGNVGDARAYRLREGTLVELTSPDEPWRRQAEEWAKIRASEHSIGCILPPPGVTLGARGEPFLQRYDIRTGDLVVLSTNGLYDMLDLPRIQAILTAESNLETRVTTLVGSANEAGGKDNIGIVLVQMG